MPERPNVYIVTGGAGFIGSNLVARLQRDDPSARIYIVDDFRTGSHANLVEACERHGCGPFKGTIMPDSVSDLNWQPALVGLEPKAVFHLGAITDTLLTDEKEMISVNAESFNDILDACIECSVPLVYASSAATYGSPPQAETRTPFPESAAGSPNNVYGFSKWLMDVEAQRAIDEAETAPHVVGLRYFNVFGPCEARKGRMASMVLHLTRQILSGNTPRLFEHGHHERDQIFVDDIVGGTIAASKPGVTPGIYNLGTGKTTSFNELLSAINKGLGTDAQPEYFAMPESMIDSYQHYTGADMNATIEALGWEPEHDPLEAISVYAQWIRDHERSVTTS